MSHFATTTIRFEGANHSPHAVIAGLVQCGWNADDHGGITYLPLGNTDEADWHRSEISELQRILEQIDIKSERHEMVGIVLLWRDSQVGGQFIIPREGELWTIWNVNTMRLHNHPNISDVSWYLEKLLPVISKLGIRLRSIEWKEVV